MSRDSRHRSDAEQTQVISRGQGKGGQGRTSTQPLVDTFCGVGVDPTRPLRPGEDASCVQRVEEVTRVEAGLSTGRARASEGEDTFRLGCAAVILCGFLSSVTAQL